MGKRRKTCRTEIDSPYFHLVPCFIAPGVFFAALWMLPARGFGVELTPAACRSARAAIAFLAYALTWAPLSLIALRFAGPAHHFVVLYGVGALVYILAFLLNGFFWTGVLLQRAGLSPWLVLILSSIGGVMTAAAASVAGLAVLYGVLVSYGEGSNSRPEKPVRRRRSGRRKR